MNFLNLKHKNLEKLNKITMNKCINITVLRYYREEESLIENEKDTEF